MPIFCEKCGSQLYSDDICPICGTAVVQNKTTEPEPPQASAQSLYPMTDAQKQKLKNKIIHRKNKARKNVEKTLKLRHLSNTQKGVRITLMCTALLLVCVIVLTSVLSALVYFNKADIPFISKALASVGVVNKSDKAAKKAPAPQVTDADSALKKAKSLAKDKGYTTAAEELVLIKEYSENNTTNYEFQQKHNNIPVFAKLVVLCVDNHGHIINKTIELTDINTDDVVPTLDKDWAKICIRDDIMQNQSDFIYKIDSNEVLIEEYSENQLVYFTDANETAYLSYKLNITALDTSYIYVVDAHEGTVYYSEKLELANQGPTTEPTGITAPPVTDEPTQTEEITASADSATATEKVPENNNINNNKKSSKPDFTLIFIIAGSVILLVAILFVVFKLKRKNSDGASKYPKTF